jgi:hypothetical protein
MRCLMSLLLGRRYLATIKERLASAMDLEAGQLDAPYIQAEAHHTPFTLALALALLR